VVFVLDFHIFAHIRLPYVSWPEHIQITLPFLVKLVRSRIPSHDFCTATSAGGLRLSIPTPIQTGLHL
jgi:hypothetical protein